MSKTIGWWATMVAVASSCGCAGTHAGAGGGDSGMPSGPGGGPPGADSSSSDTARPEGGTTEGGTADAKSSDVVTPGDDGSIGPSPDSPTCTPVEGAGVFSAPNVWTKDVSCEPIDPNSTTMMHALTQVGGWGSNGNFQIDISLVVLHADASTPMVPFVQGPGYALPDCDVFSSIPLPPGGAIEGQTGYTCDAAHNDCHLLIVYPPTHTLYEVYQANMVNGSMVGGGGFLWDLTKTYPDNLRGDQCTSADAAGFPLAAMLPDADEVATGTVGHAIRFALPNASMRSAVYVHPATHAGAPSGGASLPPYGVRLRLRADYPVAGLSSTAAQVLARTLQRYGMFLSDGGTIPLMVQTDQFTSHKWADADLNLDSHALFGILPTDFEVVDLPATVALTYDCVRNP